MTVLLLIAVGIALSAFFSGSETGFYRVTRVRLVMDAKSGKWTARLLLWLVNHTTVVVATVLIGNNIANYLVSLGLLLAGQQFLSEWGQLQSLLPLLMTPVLFIYGELLPKYLYYQVPYRLLKRGAAPMAVFSGLFLPVSALVIALEKLSQRWLGNNTLQAGSSLERQELQRVLVEGQEAGVLQPVQRELAQNLFTFGPRPVRQFAIPLRALALVSSQASAVEILEQATRRGLAYTGVLDDSGQRLIGCFPVADLLVAPGKPPKMLAVPRISPNDSALQSLIKLQSSPCPVAALEDESRTLGVVEKERLMALLLP